MTVAQGLASSEQLAQILDQARADLAAPDVGCFMPIHLAFGQRVR